MPSDPKSLALGADFPAATREEWRALVAAVLARSGVEGDPEEALSHTTYDGIRIKPLYTVQDVDHLDADGRPGHPPYVRGSTASGAAAGGWDVRTRPPGPDAASVNRAALQDLGTGATSLWLTVGEGGLPVADLPAVLAGVYLDLAPIALDAGAHSVEALEALVATAQQRGVDPAELRGTAGADPIGRRARTGADADLDVLSRLAERRAAVPGLQLATVDATVYHDAGASDAQELGVATAVGVAYLRALTDAGLSVDEALDALEFRWAVTVEQFPSIAKLRAARRVWARVAELSGARTERRGQSQHAVTSGAMLTRRDPWVNLLRTTVACFAAAVGGADAVTVAPFDAAIGVSDDFARRIARNTQSILHDESSLARVIDAAGGAWFVESLTDRLAEKAWDVFTSVERAGGALAALDNGTIGSLLAATRAQRADDIAHRRSPITGVSEYAFVQEAPVERAPLPPAPDGLLPRGRYAEQFEALRDRSDAAPERPRVFLATLGPLAAHSGRAGFAANLFAAAGIESVTGTVDEFAANATPVACLCSSDRIYAEEAAAATKTLREAGADHVWLAGQVETDGVDGYVHVGVDAVAVLRRTLERLGVQ
jgi:methylmalonyl-CoA mutase